ncbi:MAG: hypothetical protein KJ955_07065 [Nanoarchaeota archaeon]|nr:hypothetical protein [Nanoarchaeota archaeon]
MPIRKKAVVVLSLSAIAFFIAVIMLSHDVIRLAPGPKADYLGQTEIKMFNAYVSGEEQRLYIDMAAKYAYDKAGGKNQIKEDEDKFMAAFTEDFEKRLESFNRIYGEGAKLISAADFEISADESSIKGITENTLVISSDDYTYLFKPNFRIIFEADVEEFVPPAEIEETCSAANGACRLECDTNSGESAIAGAVCPKSSEGLAQYCCKIPAETSAECVGTGGSCQAGCEYDEEPLDINCGTGKHCCKPKEETVPLLPSCTDMEGICRIGPAAGETLYTGATCERPNEFCFVGQEQNECESNGNECKALSCEHPSLAAEYISIHAYDSACGTGRYCCKKRS